MPNVHGRVVLDIDGFAIPSLFHKRRRVYNKFQALAYSIAVSPKAQEPNSNHNSYPFPNPNPYPNPYLLPAVGFLCDLLLFRLQCPT